MEGEIYMWKSIKDFGSLRDYCHFSGSCTAAVPYIFLSIGNKYWEIKRKWKHAPHGRKEGVTKIIYYCLTPLLVLKPESRNIRVLSREAENYNKHSSTANYLGQSYIKVLQLFISSATTWAVLFQVGNIFLEKLSFLTHWRKFLLWQCKNLTCITSFEHFFSKVILWMVVLKQLQV